MPSRSHHEAMVEKLRADPDMAVEYIRAAIEENADEPAALMVAIRRVAEAHGMQHVAEAAEVNRESLYRALSAKGNPTVKTLASVLKVMGMRLSVVPLAEHGGHERAAGAGA